MLPTVEISAIIESKEDHYLQTWEYVWAIFLARKENKKQCVVGNFFYILKEHLRTYFLTDRQILTHVFIMLAGYTVIC